MFHPWVPCMHPAGSLQWTLEELQVTLRWAATEWPTQSFEWSTVSCKLTHDGCFTFAVQRSRCWFCLSALHHAYAAVKRTLLNMWVLLAHRIREAALNVFILFLQPAQVKLFFSFFLVSFVLRHLQPDKQPPILETLQRLRALKWTCDYWNFIVTHLSVVLSALCLTFWSTVRRLLLWFGVI